MTDVREVACPKCGGPMPPPAFRSTAICPFCHATVAPAPDVEVVERVVQRVVLAPGSGAAMRCPRCAGECRAGRVRDTILQGCTLCAGLWIDNASVGVLRDRSDSDVLTLAADLTRVIAMPMPHEQRVAELSCPICQVTMRRIAIPDTIHSVDVCKEHGTWFDRGEMEMFARTFSRQREGEDLTEDDLKNAGLPGATRPGGGGFFSDVFQLLGSLLNLK